MNGTVIVSPLGNTSAVNNSDEEALNSSMVAKRDDDTITERITNHTRSSRQFSAVH